MVKVNKQAKTPRDGKKDSENSIKNKNEQNVGWNEVHVLFLQENKDPEFVKQLKKLILLDSDSNTTI